MIVQVLEPLYTHAHGKADLSKQQPWCAATDSWPACKRSRVRFPGPAGMLHLHFSPLSQCPFLSLLGDSLFLFLFLFIYLFIFATPPTTPLGRLGL